MKLFGFPKENLCSGIKIIKMMKIIKIIKIARGLAAAHQAQIKPPDHPTFDQPDQPLGLQP